MSRLVEISSACEPSIRSDKSVEYLEFYEDLFQSFRLSHVNLLEVGVLRGGSLLLFAQYFPNARILGIDLSEPPQTFYDELARLGATDRVHIALGSQNDEDFVHRNVDEWFGGELLDIVNDDASHLYETTRATFDSLFMTHLRPGGLYIIEDWGCGYWPAWPDGQPDGTAGLPRLVKELVDLVALEDRTREWQGVRALDVTQQQRSPIERAILTKGIAAFVRSEIKAWDDPTSLR